jgi:hypothetical protein
LDKVNDRSLKKLENNEFLILFIKISIHFH